MGGAVPPPPHPEKRTIDASSKAKIY